MEMRLPVQVQALLDIFHHTYEQEMFVVGGAVRDYLLSKPIADYDMVLMTETPAVDIKELETLADRLGLDFNHTTRNSDYPTGFVRLSTRELKIEIWLVEPQDIKQYVNRFPVNVSKVYITVLGEIHKLPDFVNYVKTGKLHFDFSETGADQEMRDAYELKIRRKFA